MSIPKPTENTVTAFLKDELEKFGVKAIPFASIHTPAGRREVDILCENAGLYPIEAKFTENELLTAISKIQNDYLKYHRELGIKGGFAILYPSKLSEPIPIEVLKEMLKTLKFKVILIFLPEDTRKNFTVYEGTLTEIAQKLSKQILTPPKYIEPNIEWIIKSLRESANYITVGLKHLAGKQLEEIFGGEHVFKNILNYEEERKYPVEELRLASAYLLVNQLLFYHVLSRKLDFPEIETDQLRTPSQLNQYFKSVLTVNYRAIFSYDVASKIPKRYVDIVKIIIDVIKSISPEKIGGDLLGTIFHDLIPLDVRKYVAAFYTNVLAANLLAWLAIDHYNAKVADFAVGSGGLLVAAYRRKKYLLEAERKEFSQKMHELFIEQLLGVDVMPFAASVAASHLALQSPEYHTNKVNIAIWDSTELKPNMKIPSIAGLKTILRGQTNLDMFIEEGKHVKGVVRLGEEEPEEIILTKYDVIIMNPPFTRQERIPEDYKKLLYDRFEDYKDYLHGQLGYYGYFILLADRFLKENGRLAFVLPAAFLRVKSASGIRKFLSENYNIEYIITGKKRLNFSESTWRREILFIARKIKKGGKRKHSIFAAIEKLPETKNDLERICAKIKKV
ncbi:MAG: N-6 DNA methylase, partial [Candidatus Odinarchaeota archaeon]|nr:N-6 DNA methylase [Candidatus Odinarchaeota archaeon]